MYVGLACYNSLLSNLNTDMGLGIYSASTSNAGIFNAFYKTVSCKVLLIGK